MYINIVLVSMTDRNRSFIFLNKFNFSRYIFQKISEFLDIFYLLMTSFLSI